jgi:hypothetical protein
MGPSAGLLTAALSFRIFRSRSADTSRRSGDVEFACAHTISRWSWWSGGISWSTARFPLRTTSALRNAGLQSSHRPNLPRCMKYMYTYLPLEALNLR